MFINNSIFKNDAIFKLSLPRNKPVTILLWRIYFLKRNCWYLSLKEYLQIVDPTRTNENKKTIVDPTEANLSVLFLSVRQICFTIKIPLRKWSPLDKRSHVYKKYILYFVYFLLVVKTLEFFSRNSMFVSI